ncbi:tripartite tricarboxylate transporter substrate binding protein [Rhodoplanes sp. TEM]|uniref:Tripartite tricarboxylate transporter substrate binding protein n=1 Tax=Rhodoplanes tepidamans TaxID=200616 RepID=A0ABT5JJD4_RHOTP|nr:MULTISPECIES: tripartite tricarboxylate transporter substrate binding protein [Rhodoplanes]MDC7789707.1 tripartite tricarboxylate transporter substrate binding protein [Rhodoplanes tepidamans]MDC7984386.1 tripartite tricarboxylate transporter substrate binding protein [Rhodoplanes sp. TEM]MDQ0358344.1 tripartite-type tricarboxylate transporter receptor subunit TctC [Rhodoplanes tepidamans]
MMHRRDFLIATAASAGSLAAAPVLAQSDALPKRPIRLIVPFAAGGGVDVFARLLAEKLKEKNGITIVVENRGGANGSIGGSAVRTAEPDGTTLLFSAATHVMARQVMKSPPYDPVTDFTPVARVGEAPMLVVMAPGLPFKTIAEVVADARKTPDKWTFATSALGAPGHLATVAFNKLAGLNLTIAPYRGTAPGLTDVAAGHVQLMIDPVLALLPMARGGNVKALAVTAAKRVALAPEIPTAAESGMPGLEYASWYGVWGPKGMPADLVARLNKACNEAAVELGASGRLAELGIEPVSGTPEAFADFIAKDVKRNTELLKSVNFEPV